MPINSSNGRRFKSRHEEGEMDCWRTIPEDAYRHLLFVCTAGKLRSATAADIYTRKGFLTRAVGADPAYAVCPLTDSALAWADLIFVMEDEHAETVRKMFNGSESKIRVLDIPDVFEYMNPKLQELIEERTDPLLTEKYGDLDPIHSFDPEGRRP